MKKTLLSFIIVFSILSINAQNHIYYNRYDAHNDKLIKRHNRPRVNILPIIGAAITGAIIANQINDSYYYDNQREIIRQNYWRAQLEIQRLELIQRQLELQDIENRRQRGGFRIFNRRHNRY